MRILALDMATTTGWCAGDGASLPTLGHYVLPRPADGARGATFATHRSWLCRLIKEQAPDVVLGEQAILPKPFIKDGRIIWNVNIETTLLLQGLWAVLEEVAYACGVTCEHVTVGQVKKELTGSGKAEKPDMVAAARRMGLQPAVHDEADALGIFSVGVRIYCDRPTRDAWDRRIWSSRGTLL